MKLIRGPGPLGPLAWLLVVMLSSSLRLAAADPQPVPPSADAAQPQRLA